MGRPSFFQSLRVAPLNSVSTLLPCALRAPQSPYGLLDRTDVYATALRLEPLSPRTALCIELETCRLVSVVRGRRGPFLYLYSVPFPTPHFCFSQSPVPAYPPEVRFLALSPAP